MNKYEDLVVYVAAPYRAKTWIGELINIYEARQVARRLWRDGIVVLSPHSNSGFIEKFDDPIKDGMMLEGCIDLMLRCDVVYVPGEISSGVKAEIEAARVKGMPVMFNYEDLIEWVINNKRKHFVS